MSWHWCQKCETALEDLLLEDETMEELYKVMDDLLDLEFQIKTRMDICNL